MSAEDSLPSYTYVPGGPWPHPSGLSPGRADERPPPIDGDAWRDSPAFLRGCRLFNAGYYWEAHEAWEGLWHAHGRVGPVADLFRALIKLAAAGVKVRERQPAGVITHAGRAAELLDAVRRSEGPRRLGLDLAGLAAIARRIAGSPPTDPAPPGVPVSIVFEDRLEPA